MASTAPAVEALPAKGRLYTLAAQHQHMGIIARFMLENAVQEMAEAAVNPQRYLEHVADTIKNGAGIMAIVDGDLVGYLGIKQYQFSYSDESFLLDTGFWVLPEHRDGDAFKALLQEARGIAEHAQMILKIVVNNPSRQRGPRSRMAMTSEVIGYRPHGRVLTFYPRTSN